MMFWKWHPEYFQQAFCPGMAMFDENMNRL